MEDTKMEVFTELIKYEPGFLDRPLKELVPLRFLGEVAVDAYKALIKRIDNIPMAQKEREAKLQDGQDAGQALLTIEAKIGELVKPYSFKENDGQRRGEKYQEKKDFLANVGLPERQRQKAVKIANHPKEVQEVIKEAKENDDIPTKTAVLNKIKLNKYVEKHPESEKRLPNVNEIANTVNSKLIECLTKLRSIWEYENQINQVTKDTIYETIDDLYQLTLGE